MLTQCRHGNNFNGSWLTRILMDANEKINGQGMWVDLGTSRRIEIISSSVGNI